MKKIILLLLLFSKTSLMNAQVFEVDTLQYKGNTDKFINIVILGDGFTETEQSLFIVKANELMNYVFTQTPWSNYTNYFNIFAIKVISNESGVKHANSAWDCPIGPQYGVPVSNPDNYFGSEFDNSGIHRLVVPTNTTRIANVLANNFPNYDLLLMIVNSPYYGGSGGFCATTTLHPDSYEVITHELGHSFANLGDEYDYVNYFGEMPNMTHQSDPTLIKWRNWLNQNESIGIFSYSGSTQWYKPSTNHCRMELYGVPYCAVCRQTITEKIHTLTNPIVSYIPTDTSLNSTNPILDFSLAELMKPTPNTLKITWQLDALVFENNSETFQINQNTLTEGIHSLTASVIDTTAYVRVDNHATTHIHSVTWTIDHSNLGTQWQTNENIIALSLFPNPSNDFVNVNIELEKSASVTISIISMDGRVIQTLPTKELTSGINNSLISIATLSQGNYIVALKINGSNYSKLFTKE